MGRGREAGAPEPDFASSPGLSASQTRAALDRAVCGLRRNRPSMSAYTGLTLPQKLRLAILGAGCAGLLIMAGGTGRDVLVVIVSLPFACITLLRAYALLYYLTRRPRLSVPGAIAPKAGYEPLPSYSILVPLYKEVAVVRDLMQALRRLDYPPSRLEILLITEETDQATRVAIELVGLAPNMRVVTVPDGMPRTKPRALNYALAFAHGDYIAIYDAEDAPEPGQLKMAVRAFRTRPGRIGCVQARLDIYTPPSTFVSSQFTIEYLVLFYVLLPAYQRLGIPMPLGGTSNHFPRRVLEEVGGWDPFNVTEDADLGLRLARAGYGVAMIGSATWEEAPLKAGLWLGQRTRWIKGWIQTYIVHTRSRRRLLRDLGWRGYLGFHLVFGGMLFSALAHPVAYLLLGWQLTQGAGVQAGWISMPQSALWSFCLLNLVVSYGLAVLSAFAVAVKRKRRGLLLAALMTPCYWLLISAAAYLALFDFLLRPHYWCKTRHTGAGRHRINRTGRVRAGL